MIICVNKDNLLIVDQEIKVLNISMNKVLYSFETPKIGEFIDGFFDENGEAKVVFRIGNKISVICLKSGTEKIIKLPRYCWVKNSQFMSMSEDHRKISMFFDRNVQTIDIVSENIDRVVRGEGIFFAKFIGNDIITYHENGDLCVNGKLKKSNVKYSDDIDICYPVSESSFLFDSGYSIILCKKITRPYLFIFSQTIYEDFFYNYEFSDTKTIVLSKDKKRFLVRQEGLVILFNIEEKDPVFITRSRYAKFSKHDEFIYIIDNTLTLSNKKETFNRIEISKHDDFICYGDDKIEIY